MIERLRDMVEVNCRALIDDDHDVSVQVVQGKENCIFEIYCEPGDAGLIIGHSGWNIEAMRTLVRSGCRGHQLRTNVEVMDSRT